MTTEMDVLERLRETITNGMDEVDGTRFSEDNVIIDYPDPDSMKLTKIVALALLAALLVFAVSCEDANPKEKTLTITIHRGSNGEVLSKISDIPASITTWAELIASEYNHFDEFDWYGGFGHASPSMAMSYTSWSPGHRAQTSCPRCSMNLDMCISLILQESCGFSMSVSATRLPRPLMAGGSVGPEQMPSP